GNNRNEREFVQQNGNGITRQNAHGERIHGFYFVDTDYITGTFKSFFMQNPFKGILNVSRIKNLSTVKSHSGLKMKHPCMRVRSIPVFCQARTDHHVRTKTHKGFIEIGKDGKATQLALSMRIKRVYFVRNRKCQSFRFLCGAAGKKKNEN